MHGEGEQLIQLDQKDKKLPFLIEIQAQGNYLQYTGSTKETITLCFALLVPLLLILNIRIQMPARNIYD